ncbi:MAG: hypothetical protein EOO20_21695 [Chryseobacterium sp.]|nr:MAG: hypothetical protein EOO20_21695 [Chryseobacterium sp.]
MKNLLSFFLFLTLPYCYCQCYNYSGCNPNSGLYSGNDPEDIDYDNIITAYHSTVIKDAFNNYKIWGSYAAANGVDNVLSPQYINSTNYPALTGDIKKVALGDIAQLIVLTSDGLFVSGVPGRVIPISIKSTPFFERITVNGKSDGLPPGVNPTDVRMLFATSQALMITTCQGAVYVLSESTFARGDGNTGSDAAWARVMENATTPLTDVIVTRGQIKMGFALKKDGSLWTWGKNVYTGKNSDGYYQDIMYATKMTVPASVTGIKMIQATALGVADYHTYYLLDNKNTLYCLGFNSYGEFGFRTFPIIKVWTPS